MADGVFADIDVSGAVHPEERPAMRRLLEAVDRGELGGVVAFDLSRLSRDPAHGDWLVRRITEAGGLVTTPDMPDDVTSATGEFQFGIMLQVARLYRRTAGERLDLAKARAAKAGIPVGPIPVGYRQRTDRTLEPDPTEAPAVRALFERRATGAGYTELADLLEARTGRPWTRQAIAAILRNRIYATGRLEYGGVVAEHEAGALVDEPLWHAAQRVDPRPRPPRDLRARWLLSGLLKCETCGHNLAPWTGARRRADNGKAQKPPRRYRCQNRKCPARVSVDAPRVERWVVLRSFAAGDEMVTRAQAPDLGALEEAAAKAGRRLEQVMAPEARDALGDLWAADVKARRAEVEEALTRLGEARALAGVPEEAFRLRDVWEGMDGVERRDALALFWKEIRVGRRRPEGGTPLVFVARGPTGEAEVTMDGK